MMMTVMMRKRMKEADKEWWFCESFFQPEERNRKRKRRGKMEIEIQFVSTRDHYWLGMVSMMMAWLTMMTLIGVGPRCEKEMHGRKGSEVFFFSGMREGGGWGTRLALIIKMIGMSRGRSREQREWVRMNEWDGSQGKMIMMRSDGDVPSADSALIQRNRKFLGRRSCGPNYRSHKVSQQRVERREREIRPV